MSKVEIINPLPGGMRYTSAERAHKFCSLGMATMSVDGRLLFTISNQTPLVDRMREEDEIARNRGGMIYWNGRIIRVSEAKVIGGTSATFDALAEFDKASGVRTVFGFFRSSKHNPWKLRSFKIVLPMPREADEAAPQPVSPAALPQPPALPPPSRSPRDAGAK